MQLSDLERSDVDIRTQRCRSTMPRSCSSETLERSDVDSRTQLLAIVQLYQSRTISAPATLKIGECLGLVHERVHEWIIRERAMLCESIKTVYMGPVMAYLLAHSSRRYFIREAMIHWRQETRPPLTESSGDEDNRVYTSSYSSSEEDDSNNRETETPASATTRWFVLGNSGRVRDTRVTVSSNVGSAWHPSVPRTWQGINHAWHPSVLNTWQGINNAMRRWSRQRHWGLCADDCVCCRARLSGSNFPCEECSNGWVLTTVSKEFKGSVNDFATRKYPLRYVSAVCTAALWSD